MAIKYECPKCGRRFTEWGAEKVGFRCPADEWSSHTPGEEVELVRVGASDEHSPKRASLKRHSREAIRAAKPVLDEDETLVADVDEVLEDAEEEEEEEEVAVGETEVVEEAVIVTEEAVVEEDEDGVVEEEEGATADFGEEFAEEGVDDSQEEKWNE